MHSLSQRIEQISSAIEFNALADQMLSLVIDVYHADEAELYMLRPSSQLLLLSGVQYSATHVEAPFDPSFHAKNVRQDLAKTVLQSKIPLFAVQNNASGAWIEQINPPDDPSNTDAVLSFPLTILGRVLGIVQIYNPIHSDVKPLKKINAHLTSNLEKAMLLERSMAAVNRQKALTSIIGTIVATLDREQILRMIIDNARELLNVEACSLFLVDESAGDIVLRLASNIDPGINMMVEQVRVPMKKGIIGSVVETGETILVEDVLNDQRFYSKVDQRSGFESRSILAVPLRARTLVLGAERGEIKERIIGGLEAINKINGRFTEEDAEVLRTLTNQAATVLEIARLYADTNELFMDVIEVLSAAIDAKDAYTEGHSRRVSEFSVEIALELGIPQETVQQIRIGGLLHDVGKIGIPDTIITKNGRLDDDQYTIMKKHPQIGARIMSEVRMLQEILPALSGHHERLDGKGYPQGLAGKSIPLISRIIAVADVFDAMTSDRPYRRALPPEEAFQYLRSEINNNFDESCVEALISAYHKKRIHIQSKRASPHR